MTFIDRPVSRRFDRTPRELAVIGIGVFGAAFPIFDARYYRWEWTVSFAVATVLLAVRFWPARALAVGACLASLAQCACVRKLDDWPWVTAVAAAAVVLLSSRDLSARFEESPSRIAWFPNAWAALPRSDARRLRFSAYALGVLAAVLFQEWCMGSTAFPWSPAVVVVLSAAIVLLALGKAVALLAVAGLSAAVAASVAPALVETPETMVSQPDFPAASLRAGLAFGAATIAFGLAAPYVWRLVRRAVA